ncbi:MAG TPA: hypothetical protein DIT32_07275 [Peptococcaceae bacterium]|nr:hypothetical protein [Peptococcaceae bacterium]
MKIQVCVGSSCHLKGAPAVIAAFQEAMKNEPSGKNILELGGCYCQDHCQNGVVVRIDGRLYTNVTPEMVAPLLEEGAESDE